MKTLRLALPSNDRSINLPPHPSHCAQPPLRRHRPGEWIRRVLRPPPTDPGALRKLLKAWQPLSINHRGSAGCTFLHSVVADARLSPAQTVQCVRELLEKHGADASRGNDLRMAPLMSAAALMYGATGLVNWFGGREPGTGRILEPE